MVRKGQTIHGSAHCSQPPQYPCAATVAYRGAVRSRKLTPRVYWIMGKWVKSLSVNNLSEEMFKL